MRILTLFLTLFLTILPDSVPCANTSFWQDVSMEEVFDIEGDAIIHTFQRKPIGIQDFSEIIIREWAPAPIHVLPYHSIHFCFERQWLTSCTLRL